MAGYERPWSLCGGWAVDAWVGRLTRDHGDVDISVFQEDLTVLFEHLRGWQLVAHDPNVAGDTSELWNGRRIDIPGHIHARVSEPSAEMPERLEDPGKQGFGLDIQIDDRDGDDWVMRREPRISLPVSQGIAESAWGLPTATPGVLLFFKSADPRLRDKLDFAALLPLLTSGQRDWLRNAIELTGHPWLARLSA